MTTREEELGTYEMLWNCGACGSEKLLGVTHRHCPNCGAAQEASRRYFPSDEEKVAVADHRYTGVDHQCAACGSPSAAAAVHCPNCGAPLAEGKAVATKGAERIADGQAFSSSRGNVSAPPPANPVASARQGAPLKVIAIGVAVVLALFVACRKRSATLEVVAHHWRLERPIEVFTLTTQSAWRDQLPPRVQLVECHRETRSTRRVPDGERCERVRKDLGNGAFQESRECTPQFREEDVDDERCSFQVPTWTRARVDRAEGQGLTTPRRFATEGPTRTGQCLGCERAGSVDEVFEIEVRQPASGTSARCTVPRARWESLTDGQVIQAEVRALGGAIACASVAAER